MSKNISEVTRDELRDFINKEINRISALSMAVIVSQFITNYPTLFIIDNKLEILLNETMYEYKNIPNNNCQSCNGSREKDK